jgi:intergrase/recombinase
VQKYDGFVKVTLDWSRGSKNALFAYMPTELYQSLGKAQQDFAGLQTRIKKLKLVPLKYCRKWFAQKCLEADIKPEVVDFFQGRAPRTVLLNHYINLQTFANRDYDWVMVRIKEAIG